MFGNPSWTNPFDQPQGGGFGGVANTVGQPLATTPAEPFQNGGFGGVNTVAPNCFGGAEPAAPDAIWGHPPADGPVPGQGQGLWGNQPNLYQRQFDSAPQSEVQGVPLQPLPARAEPTASFDRPVEQGIGHMPGQGQGQMQGQMPTQQPTQHMPTQQLPAQQMPFEQMPTQQMPGQQIPTQQMPTQHVPAQHGQMPGQMSVQFGGNFQPAPFMQPGVSNSHPHPAQPLYGNQTGNQSTPLNQMQQFPPQNNLFGQPQAFSQPPGMPLDGLQFAPADTRSCTCGITATFLTVKKEGPNQGRGFFKCPKQHPDQPCKFFEWADEPPRAAPQNGLPGAPTEGVQLPPGPNCPCGQPTLTLTVRKDGPNQGRQFHKCAQGQCKFFEWADAEADPQGPPCPCGVPSASRVTQKDGPNKGRPFFV